MMKKVGNKCNIPDEGNSVAMAHVEARNGRMCTEELSVLPGCGRESVKGCSEGGQEYKLGLDREAPLMVG